jgi:hypothetical protein
MLLIRDTQSRGMSCKCAGPADRHQFWIVGVMDSQRAAAGPMIAQWLCKAGMAVEQDRYAARCKTVPNMDYAVGKDIEGRRLRNKASKRLEPVCSPQRNVPHRQQWYNLGSMELLTCNSTIDINTSICTCIEPGVIARLSAQTTSRRDPTFRYIVA